jgi:hypothetical protein
MSVMVKIVYNYITTKSHDLDTSIAFLILLTQEQGLL